MRIFHFIWDAWRAMTWRLAGLAVLAGVGLYIVHFATHQGFFVAIYQFMYQRSTFFGQAATIFYSTQLFVFVFFLCILVARRVVAHGGRRVVAYSVAIVVAALVCALADYGIKQLTGFYEESDTRAWWKPVDAAWILLTVILLGAPCTFAYADFQRARESAARLHAAGLARTRAARDVVQTRLQALQARVEPQFLFDTLARVKQLYDRDAAKGEATLDALIAYLRIAMPQMRQPGSTLARECELARTYVEIVSARGDVRLRVAIDDGDDSVNEPFPAMLLLPLVEHAVSISRATPLDDNAIEIRAAISGTRLAVTVGHSGNAFASDDAPAVGRVREQLRTLFDDEARFETRTADGGGSELTMEVPHEQR
jgi:hypothetical protein